MMATIPVVLCMDLEPDRRGPDRDAAPPAGISRLFPLVEQLRDQVASMTGASPAFTWGVRMDPQIAEVYGAPEWIATTYADQLAVAQAAGDAIGLHQHSWRWRDGWVSDQADADWVAHCVQVGLDSYRTVFGTGCVVYRHGDGFMSTAVARQLADAGVRVDLTLEPGFPARSGLVPREAATGQLPDTRTVPRSAYWPSGTDFTAPDPTRTAGLLMLPLTSSVAVSTHYRAGRLVPTGANRLLELSTDPERFRRMLRTHLRQPDCTHVAFALRSDIGLLPGAWANLEHNVGQLSGELAGRHAWCTPLTARDLIESSPPAATVRRDGSTHAGDRRATLWLRGADDPGYRTRAEPEAFEVLMRDGGSRVDRVRALGGRPDSAGIVDDDARIAAVTTDRADSVTPELDWVSEACELTCPVCGRSGVGHRFAVVTTRRIPGRGVGITRCASCRAIVPEWPAVGTDLSDADIDERVESTAGVDAALLTLMQVTPSRELRFLDVGCGYGFALDLAHFAWGWAGTGVDPSNLARRGRDDLGVDIRGSGFRADLDLAPEPFDVILASEALEHFPDPPALLAELRARLAADGVLVMSTPNAAFVTPSNPAKEIVAALGLGTHTCLVDRAGLERILRDAGFDAVQIDDAALTLRAVASPTAAGLARCVAPPAGPDLELLARYCDARAESAPERSALQLGMAARFVQYSLHAGDHAAAAGGQGRLRDALLARHGIDLDNPEGTVERAAVRDVPMVAAGAHFSIGFLELVAYDRPERAARQFSAAAMAASSMLDNASPAPVWLQLRATGHEALAQARFAPDRAPDTLRRLRNATRQLVGTSSAEIDALCQQVLDELMARGHTAAADAARPLVAEATMTSDAERAADAAGRVSPRRRAENPGPPRVSVIIPLYNGARHLLDAVASVTAQTHLPEDLVVVDDGSTDDALDALQTVSAPFPIRVVRQPRGGQSSARNRGVQSASGDMLAFLDQDDTWHPEHLAVLCRNLVENPRVGWVYSDFDEIDSAGRTVTLSFLSEHGVQHPRRSLGACLVENLMVIPSASVIRRSTFESLGGFDEQLQGYEDDDLYVRAFRAGTPMIFEPRSLTCFRVHPTSSSANGRFAESRLLFSHKLRHTVADDQRLNRYYFRDVIAPRFLHDALDDYVRAVSDEDWATAGERLADLEYFARLHRDHAALRWKLALIRNPRRFRWVLRVADSLPVRPRVLRNPVYRLRRTR